MKCAWIDGDLKIIKLHLIGSLFELENETVGPESIICLVKENSPNLRSLCVICFGRRSFTPTQMDLGCPSLSEYHIPCLNHVQGKPPIKLPKGCCYFLHKEMVRQSRDCRDTIIEIIVLTLSVWLYRLFSINSRVCLTLEMYFHDYLIRVL